METFLQEKNIRPLRQSDIAAAVTIIDQNYPGELYSTKARRELEAMFGDGPIKPYFFVCDDTAGRLLGFGGYIQSWMDYHIYELFWINVAQAAQRQGIGTMLVHALFEAIKREDAQAKAIIGSTLVANFYKKLGSVEKIKFSDRSFLLVKGIR